LDDISGTKEKIIEHVLRQSRGRGVLLARVVRAENGRAERMKDLVSEFKIGDPLDARPGFLDPQPRIESYLSEYDHQTQVRQTVQFAFEVPAAIQQLIR
jgi:hypothetical protein